MEVIDILENQFLATPQVPCPVRHILGEGVYIREVFLPAGVYAIGHHQNKPQLNVMLRGRVAIRNDDGSFTELDATHAPLTFMGKAGRKVGFIHEDTIWQNIFPTNERDLSVLEKTYITKSEQWLMIDTDRKNQLMLEYKGALKDLDVLHETAQAESENESDQIPLPCGTYKFMLSESMIHGKGLIASCNIYADETIAPARVDGKRTPAGRYTNHSDTPNARMVRREGDIYLVANQLIAGCLGGQDGEEITVDYRQANKVRICQV